MFFRKKNKVTAIKLYSIEDNQVGISRPELIDSVFKAFEEQFSEIPVSYVIHGPYGIRKGGSVGIKAFKSKLNAKNHEKYYALTGKTEGKLGFNLLLDAILENQTYSELIIWWYTDCYTPSFEDVVKAVSPFYPISSGFELQFDDSYDTFSESKIKKGFFGGASTYITYDRLKWIVNYESGDLRAVFGKNILSEAQLKRARVLDGNIQSEQVGEKYFVYSGV
ncbi:hypothetical protein [Pseudoalteromonas xiamenensis]